MTRSSLAAFARHIALPGAALCALLGCASAHPAAVMTRLVSPDQWPAVTDCVVLAARASEFFAEVDSTGITVTPGVMPLAQQRAASRAGVIGTLRLTPVKSADGLRVTAAALNWDPPAVGRSGTAMPSATRAMARQLDAQCLDAYPAVAAE